MKSKFKFLIIFMIGFIIFFAMTKPIFASKNNLNYSEQKLISQNLNASQKKYIRNDGTLMVNEKPFFPLGFYHEWFNQSRSSRIEDLQTISKAGFNIIHPDISDNYKEELDFLDEAEKLGIYVIPYYFHPKMNSNYTYILSQYTTKPAILGWDIADDVDYPTNNYTPENISKLNKDVKDVAAHYLTYISGFSKKIREFLNSADLIGFQSYPVSSDPNEKKPWRRNYYNMLTATETENGTLHQKPIIANLQTFPWNDSEPPNFKEIYNMTYAALINGVKGIIYYSYYIDEISWKLSEKTDLWNGMKSLVPEINTLSPVFLNGQLTKLSTQVDDLYASQWTYNNQVYVIVVSTSPKESLEVSINIPAQTVNSAQPVFSGRASGLFFEDGKLKGKIEPGDVHIYQLSKQ